MRVIGVAMFIVAATAATSTIAAPADACESGPAFQVALRAYVSGDYVAAASGFDSLAKAGDPCGQYWIGKMHNLGQGVAKDHDAYVYALRAAAASGYSKARAELMLIQQ